MTTRIETLATLTAIEPRPSVRVLDVGDGETADIAVESVVLEDPLPTAGSEVPVRVTLRARGRVATDPLAVDLYLTEQTVTHS